ncbi:hypothetical protein Pmani_004904 [Petrolisthes manimaculis]|uniref:Replication factor C subunit 1 n=1 Tax=Petrolisthes manimaculis TaxID=1843537 RepID=A0AAE1UL39_9EUCA|nr:hypothetical protein Pmani_004904 [Petrolisthes manimaculis]
MDIRNYFSPVGAKKKSGASSLPKKDAKKKNVIIDSDEDDPPPQVVKRQRIEDSDSDDDIFEITSKKKSDKKNEEKNKNKSKKLKSLPKSESPKLKPAAAAEFFGSNPVSRKEKKSSSHTKEEVIEVIDDGDDDFSKTLAQLDEEETHKPKKPISDSKASHNEEKPKPNENSPPNKIKPEEKHSNLSQSSKLSARFRAFECRKREHEEASIPKSTKEDPKLLHRDKKIKLASTEKIVESKDESVTKKDSHKEEKARDKEREKKKSDEVRGITPKKEKKESPWKVKDEAKKTTENKITPKKEIKESSKKKPKNTPGKKLSSDIEIEVKKESPKKVDDGSNGHTEQESTPQDEKKNNAREAYMKFLRRSGPANPGSKVIPEGKPGCLQGLVFVLSGVYDSLDREEAAELIKEYGGRVTTSISRNTSYLVLGSEPGQSKLTKAEQLGTKQLDEDGLLDLIRTLPGKESKPDNKMDQSKASCKLKAFAREKKPAVVVEESVTPDDTQLVKPSSAVSTPSPKKSKAFSQVSVSSQGSPASTSSASSSPRTQSLSSQEIATRAGDVLMWVDKYKPASVKNIIGQQGDRSNVRKLLTWLKNWQLNQFGDKKPTRPSPWAKGDNGAFFKAALLSGPPGVGKTTSAHLVCKELGFDVVELNASDARSKRTLENVVSELLTNKVLTGYATSQGEDKTSARHALLMDEVDGMSGNEDRGGVQELIGLIKKAKIPIIAMCNDRNHPKIRSLANHCFDLRFQKPRIEQIRGPMMSICFREGIKIKPEALDQVILGANQDIRQILHHLTVWSAAEKNLQADDMKKEAERAKKNIKKGPWDVCRTVFTLSEHKDMNIHQKADLFFHDYSIGPLFVQENYPKVMPREAGGKRVATLELLAKTAGSLADGDLVEKLIRSHNAWSLLPTQAIFSSVVPGTHMSGHLSAQIEFPRWLGNNSRRNKFDRLMQELHMHMRLNISGSKLDVGMDYSGPVRDSVTRPLVKNGMEGVKEAVEGMTTYDLLREDLDALLELAQWPGVKDPMMNVESKVKAAFTRTFNKDSHMSPFAVPTIAKKKKVKVGEEAYGEEEEEEEEEDDDIATSGMIKQKKGAAAKKDVQSGKEKGGASSSKGKGGGVPKGRGGKGKK